MHVLHAANRWAAIAVSCLCFASKVVQGLAADTKVVEWLQGLTVSSVVGEGPSRRAL